MAGEATPQFLLEYISGPFTAANAGAFSGTHNFGVIPKLFRANLVCLTAEENYSIGDVIVTGAWLNGAGNCAFTITLTDTGFSGRWANAATNLRANNKTTGAIASLTNANWAVYFTFWA